MGVHLLLLLISFLVTLHDECTAAAFTVPSSTHRHRAAPFQTTTRRSSAVASTTDSSNDVTVSSSSSSNEISVPPPPPLSTSSAAAASSSSPVGSRGSFGRGPSNRNNNAGVPRFRDYGTSTRPSEPTSSYRSRNNNYGPPRPNAGGSASGDGQQQQQRPPQTGGARRTFNGSNNRQGGVLRLTRPLMLQRIVSQTPGTKEEIFAEPTARPPAGERRGGGSFDNNAEGGPRPPRRPRPVGEEGEQRFPRRPRPDGGTGPRADGAPPRRPRPAGAPGSGGADGDTDFRPRRRPDGPPGTDVDFVKRPLAPASDGKLGAEAARRKRLAKKPGSADPAATAQADDGRENRKSSLRVKTGRKGRAAELSQRRSTLKKRDRTADKIYKAEAALERKTVVIPERSLTVSELASIIDEKPIGVIKYLMSDLGIMASMTQAIDRATAIAVAEGFGKIVVGADELEIDLEEEGSALLTGFIHDDDEDDSELELRPPVVTIMGHVDHGKTSLLDAIRSTRVTDGEAGGITQHITAYQVQHKGQLITFIDTPGHAAFTDMRERGANITDIVILVVAADDGVMQQTKDSIMCARQAGVPVVVAINKCDLETADPNRVRTELTAYDLLTEEFGGEVLSSQISAKAKTGLDDLLDKVMLQAEIQDLKANPDRDAECIVVEAYVEKGLGTVATTLVKRGTLRVGDIFVAGATSGKVRALISTSDDSRMEYALPSTPVKVVGFEGVPSAGDSLVVASDEQTAREIAESRRRISREASSTSYLAGLMNSVNMAFGSTKEKREMCIVVKADVQGSAEALTNALRSLKLENSEATVTVKVVVSGTGEVSKSDVAIASVTPGTTILAFNVAATIAAMDDARVSNIPIEYYNIIYDAIESVESRMQEVLSPTPEGEYTGAAFVQEVFNIGGVGNIAGCKCSDGTLRRGGNIRVMRGDKILTESKIKSLRNFKSEVDVIEAGNECGIGLLEFESFLPGDIIECYVDKKK